MLGNTTVVFSGADNCVESELGLETKAVSVSLIRDGEGRQAGKFSRQTGCRTNRGALSDRAKDLNHRISAETEKPKNVWHQWQNQGRLYCSNRDLLFPGKCSKATPLPKVSGWLISLNTLLVSQHLLYPDVYKFCMQHSYHHDPTSQLHLCQISWNVHS